MLRILRFKFQKREVAVMEQEVHKEMFYTRQQLARLIWPLLLEQFLAVTMGLADTFMVSSVSEAAVSSVSLVDTLNVLVFQILSALASGGAVVVSQYMGQKNIQRMKNARRSCTACC